MIFDNIGAILKRICHAAIRADRNPDEVELIAVTKTVGIDRIREALDAGLRTFGENRLQEAVPKIRYFGDRPEITWHLIGTLQKNKARKAVELFDVIESVDSRELLEKIDQYAGELGKLQGVFIQVKLSEEETKHGIPPARVPELVETGEALENIKVEGLMTIPPFYDDKEKARPYFRRLRELRDELKGKGHDIIDLSMGMSNDFDVAIQEGSTLVRIGTAIFGRRVF
ncbi:hypothetical protein BMS3Bbin05_01993 [bacterium BMS3Bbin05]|nr:hypothetical protein BMS3Bbin05_01993 [bacterium BMS3Bbin05]HDO22973.1 YggS family pyridoxal phosphate-dependent enzyme [Nitrospirota bacterium]HDZ87292.1 YggS family pyridoxal phosphate-dependent enzyme [Nitrospirota bacterium]